MIGEIRDAETARYSIQAALTGHLVFSTLHTNDAVSAITRLKDLGLDSYLIASTLIGVVAQRLVRMVCKSCGKTVTIPAEELKAVGCEAIKNNHFKRGAGCNHCRNTGYWGRIGIYEVLSISNKIREMIHLEENEESIRKQALKEGMQTLKYDACRKLVSGITTIEEVIRSTSTS
jgi:general secretion pathway protein E